MTKHAINHYHAPNACQNTALWIDKVFKRQTIRMRTPNSLTRRRETESEENKTDNIQSFCKKLNACASVTAQPTPRTRSCNSKRRRSDDCDMLRAVDCSCTSSFAVCSRRAMLRSLTTCSENFSARARGNGGCKTRPRRPHTHSQPHPMSVRSQTIVRRHQNDANRTRKSTKPKHKQSKTCGKS